MRILDWRPAGERWLTRRWQRRGGAVGSVGPVGPVADLWGRLHGRLLARRVGSRAAPGGDAVIVSVGNLALGGTGKTPVVGDTARRLAARGIAGAVVTRGFGSALRGPVVVRPDLQEAGDEARLLAGGLAGTNWQVVQARSRPQGVATALAADLQPQVVLLEDGHQTADVGRHLDLIILDSWRIEHDASGPCVVPVTGPVFPFGPWREAAAGAARAALWLVETETEVPDRGLGGAQVLRFRREGRLQPAVAGTPAPRAPALLSGIARPERFEAEAVGLLSATPRLAIRLGDHAEYGTALSERIAAALVADHCDGLVTTAKDWVKLVAVWPSDMPIWIVDLELVWGQDTTPADVVGGRL